MNKSFMGKIFCTDEHIYFFDAGTNKVLQCSNEEAEVIQEVLDGKKKISDINIDFPELKKVISHEKVLKCPEHRDFAIPSLDDYKRIVKTSCNQVILELTESCNLRCGYCIYNEHHPGFRGFSDKNMSNEVALQSIDSILKDFKGEEFALTFYGGEPLVNFWLMKKCINYVLDNYKKLKLSISFTTNLILMTEDKIKFFSSLTAEHVDIMCSLDGPQVYHDKYRRFAGGEGSYEVATRNFKNLMKFFYDPIKKHIVSINCVIAPPYSKEKLFEIKDYFEQELHIPKELDLHYSYIEKGEMEFDLRSEEIINDDKRKNSDIPMEEWVVDEIIQGNKDKKLFDIVSKEMWMIASRVRAKPDKVLEKTNLQGNCFPGQRRVYVTVNGDFHTCERIGDSPAIGNYKDGIIPEKAFSEYYGKYIRRLNPKCDKCWARTLCTMCYEEIVDKDGVCKNIDSLCKSSRGYTEDIQRIC